jgi:hypothetical protein
MGLIASKFKLSDNVLLELFDFQMSLIGRWTIANAVKTAGIYGVMDQIIASPTLAKMGWMAIGTGTPAATLLGSENARVAFTSKTRSNAVITVVGDFGAGVGTGTITEAGTFDVVTANTVNMWMSASFGAITKGGTDTLKITWTLTGA